MDDGNIIAQKGIEETHFELWDFVKTLDFLFQYNTVKKKPKYTIIIKML